MKQGILFDLDGTLWDSADGVASSWNEIFSQYSDIDVRVTAEKVHSVMGKLLPDIALILLPDLTDARRDEIFGRCMQNENAYLEQHGGILYPDLERVLKQLKEKYSLFVVSNCQCGYIEAFLNYHRLWDCFEGTLSAGETNQPKWFNIRQVVEKYGLDQAFYVGDIQADYEAAVKAGVPFVHAAYGFGTVPEGVPSIQCLAELPAVAEKMFQK